MRLKVLVRVRPMSQREKNCGSQQIVAVESENNIAVTNVKVPEHNAGDSRERIRRFAFDYCFSENTTQEQIYRTVESIIGNSLKNRTHSSVLAYGQTSSGKTHTMMGFSQDPGLAPRLCRNIFRYFEDGALSDEATNMKVIVSYLEIYNEKVTDLLPRGDSKLQGQENRLRVREHPKKGPYVEGLTEHVVTTDEELSERLELGTSRRRVGSTTTNSKSSRSHSVFLINCDGVKLHLVDLAGNERAGSRGYGPSRFREGANINKSLVALGNVISTLAGHSRSLASSRSKFVPYRDSVLTWLLKDTLQGNSDTVMIATVSSSSACYSETINTLRFGQRAKLIVYKPVIVEDSKEKTIRELRAEIARLRDLLKISHQITPSENQMNASVPQNSETINEVPEEAGSLSIDQGSEISNASTLTSSITSLLEDPNNYSKDQLQIHDISGNKCVTNPPSLETDTTTTKSLPKMNEKSLSQQSHTKKLKRTISMDRTFSNETNTSKSFSSQESLPSPKHSITTKSCKNSSNASSSKESSLHTTTRRSSGGSSAIQPKQTALSLRRQSIHRSNPSLKTITQKKIMGTGGNKPEKGVLTEVSGIKRNEYKVEMIRKPLYPKPRSQIVAAVTSRLYNKVNKKDQATSTENLEKEAPKQLQICSNARNRLRDLTQRALKAHRSRNEETQTDTLPVLRVKEVATDCTDLKKDMSKIKDAETLNNIQKKDVAVECTFLSRLIEDSFRHILVLTRSCGSQTTNEEKSSGISFTKYLTESQNNPIFTEAVNINISHNYLNGNRSENASDDSLDISLGNNVSFPTPDLISNHNSLEQNALNVLEKTQDNDQKANINKLCFGECIDLEGSFREVNYIPSQKICASTASVLTVPQYRKNFKNVKVNSTFAPQIISNDYFKERCYSLPNFYPKKIKPDISLIPDTNKNSKNIKVENVTVFTCDNVRNSTTSESNETERNYLSDISDSIKYLPTECDKIQYKKVNKKYKNERVLNAMREFLEEAKCLMNNITHAVSRIQSNSQQPHLDDFDIQVTLNNVSGFENPKRKCKKEIIRESNGTQTEALLMESCCSQTLDYPDYNMAAVNKYQMLLEQSCNKLEETIKRTPRSRHISIGSDDCDYELSFDRLDKPKYNPWDLSNIEIDDSSLESNPVTFSDYGSLPRKTYKRQRTPTCSPSAFLRQLTNMRRNIIESSKEELMQSGSGDK